MSSILTVVNFTSMYVFLRKNHLAALFLALRQSSGGGGCCFGLLL